MAGRTRLICPSQAVEDGGPGVRFELEPPASMAAGQRPVFQSTGFVIRFCGRVHGYVNRCPHAGTELDWQPGEFFEEAKLYLVCSTHGALFEPSTGYCVAGPCRGASLERLRMREQDGHVILDDNPPNDEGES
ncbi:MAG TPA: Rieske 2Fe-2S domain-containing protein [Usitatibacter sp.]|jgi:nitrite reductase/ring-hydroxylating ferredoxin subunit|nr:Rieske 2Fe-2S domain-containing protein [Usitatibacter sp.]